jgi:hypothetical protein
VSNQQPPEPIFGETPPDGACAVRIRLRLKLSGKPPSITCTTISEESVLAEIQRNETFLRWLVRDNGGKSLTDEPRTVGASLTWLGSDGKEIDAAADVEFTYWPDGKADEKKQKTKKAGAEAVGDSVAAILPAAERLAVGVSREATAQVNALTKLVEKMVDVVDGHTKRESARVDSAIEALAARANNADMQPKQGSSSFLGSLGDLLGMAKTAKDFFGPN